MSFSDEDLKALENSAIFQEYLQDETKKMASASVKVADAEYQLMSKFESMENEIKNNPELLSKFRKLQLKCAVDSKLQAKLGSAVETIMSLDLENV